MFVREKSITFESVRVFQLSINTIILVTSPMSDKHNNTNNTIALRMESITRSYNDDPLPP